MLLNKLLIVINITYYRFCNLIETLYNIHLILLYCWVKVINFVTRLRCIKNLWKNVETFAVCENSKNTRSLIKSRGLILKLILASNAVF